MTEPPLDIECLKSPRSREEARDGRQNPQRKAMKPVREVGYANSVR